MFESAQAPSCIILKSVYQELWGFAGAHGGPRQSASFRILPRALLFVFGFWLDAALPPPTASHGRKGPHGQIKIASLTDCDSLSGNDNVATLT